MLLRCKTDLGWIELRTVPQVFWTDITVSTHCPWAQLHSAQFTLIQIKFRSSGLLLSNESGLLYLTPWLRKISTAFQFYLFLRLSAPISPTSQNKRLFKPFCWKLGIKQRIANENKSLLTSYCIPGTISSGLGLSLHLILITILRFDHYSYCND